MTFANPTNPVRAGAGTRWSWRAEFAQLTEPERELPVPELRKPAYTASGGLLQDIWKKVLSYSIIV